MKTTEVVNQLRRYPTAVYLAFSMLCLFIVLLVYPKNRLPDKAAVSPSQSAEQSLAESRETETFPNAKAEILSQTEVTVRRGSSLGDALAEAGLSGNESLQVCNALKPVLDLTRIPAGQTLQVSLNSSGNPVQVDIPILFDKKVTASLKNGAWEARQIITPLHPVPVLVHCTVNTSLYQAAVDAGIPLSVMMEAIGLFSFEVDFQRDIQSGENITLLYEKLLDPEGKELSTGKLLFACLELEERSIEAWYYQTLEGRADYYGADGTSVRKALLKTPVNGARISSGFGYRNHPILGYTALHRGVDFAVAMGTPVMAAGDGTVVIAGWHKSYGNRVKVRHANHYDTMYAHFSSIARGIVPGVKVKQGQVVGYVGSTGMSTGPHCHFEVHYYGSPVNPATLKFPPRHSLEAEDLRLFQLEIDALKAEYGI